MSAKCSKAEKKFTEIAGKVAAFAGKPATFMCMLGAVVLWAVCGPVFGFSETWQLVINTGTTIITFLMVFLIQNTQNRDTRALQIKLDELIKATPHARNKLLDLEERTEPELIAIQNEYERLAQKDRKQELQAKRGHKKAAAE